MAQTSDRVSSIAARYRQIDAAKLRADVMNGEAGKIAQDIRSMAASLHRQDEHKGLRGFIRKVTGK